MKLFVTGAAGQLGHDIIIEAEKRGHEVIGTDLGERWNGLQMDITDTEAVSRTIREINPDIVYHCAAWTAVDAAEDAGETVFRVNARGTQNIADACKETGCKMVYISTDYVFDGQGTEPWQPDCKDYAPLNVYGRSKLAGEEAAAGTLEKYFIVRIAWVFGVNGNNFIKTMLNVSWWIWAKRTGMDIITPPMKAAISAGMTSPVRYSARQVTAQR